MTEAWMGLLVQLRKRYTKLSEVYDLTVQMGEALDRNDQTSFTMLLAMRQEPVLTLQEIEKNIRRIDKDNAPEQRQRWDALQKGAPPQDAREEMVKKQMEQNRRLIDRLLPLDQRISCVLKAKNG